MRGSSSLVREVKGMTRQKNPFSGLSVKMEFFCRRLESPLEFSFFFPFIKELTVPFSLPVTLCDEDRFLKGCGGLGCLGCSGILRYNVTPFFCSSPLRKTVSPSSEEVRCIPFLIPSTSET